MNAKKLLYVCYMDLGLKPIPGIRRKVFDQVETFKKCGYDVTLVYLQNDHMIINHFKDNRLISLKNPKSPSMIFAQMNRWLLDDKNSYDAVYIRYAKLRLIFIRYLKKLRKNNCRRIMEMPTFPFEGEERKWAFAHGRKEILKYYIKYLNNSICKLLLPQYIDRIATYSKDPVIWNIQTIPIHNGVDIEKINVRNEKVFDRNSVHAIAVSACDVWHGYDRVIEGMRRYYRTEPSGRFDFHIVGSGSETGHYEKLVKEYGLEKYVHFYGVKVGADLDEIYNQCDVAFDALGRHRVGVSYNSSIKGKEYAAKGLPVVSGVATEFDEMNEKDCYFRVPADETPVDIHQVIEFCSNSYQNKNLSQKIRKIAENHFSFDVVMKPIIEYFNGVSGS